MLHLQPISAPVLTPPAKIPPDNVRPVLPKTEPRTPVNHPQLQRLYDSGGGFCPIPNALLDRLRGYLKRNEYDVFMYILRRTLGFNKISDAISLNQFQNGIITRAGRRLDYGCGIKSHDTITKALRSLEQTGFIKREAVNYHNGANGSNLYTLAIENLLQLMNAPDDTTELPQDEATAADKYQADYSPSAAPYPPQIGEGYAKNRGGDTPADGEGYADFRPHNMPAMQLTDQNTDTNTKAAGGGASPNLTHQEAENVPENPQVTANTAMLTDFGFDVGTALRLAHLAVQYNKEASYVPHIIAYSLKNAKYNPLGMVKYLLEQGEERNPAPQRKLSAAPQPRFSGWLDAPAEPEPPYQEPTSIAEYSKAQVLMQAEPVAPLTSAELLAQGMCDPQNVIQAFEKGQTSEEEAVSTLRRLGVYARYDVQLYQARKRRQLAHLPPITAMPEDYTPQKIAL